jgi:hypothetical protein
MVVPARLKPLFVSAVPEPYQDFASLRQVTMFA